MTVCRNCLKEIESHEGKQYIKPYKIEDGRFFNEDNEEVECEFYKEKTFCSDALVIL